MFHLNNNNNNNNMIFLSDNRGNNLSLSLQEAENILNQLNNHENKYSMRDLRSKLQLNIKVDDMNKLSLTEEEMKTVNSLRNNNLRGGSSNTSTFYTNYLNLQRIHGDVKSYLQGQHILYENEFNSLQSTNTSSLRTKLTNKENEADLVDVDITENMNNIAAKLNAFQAVSGRSLSEFLGTARSASGIIDPEDVKNITEDQLVNNMNALRARFGMPNLNNIEENSVKIELKSLQSLYKKDDVLKRKLSMLNTEITDLRNKVSTSTTLSTRASDINVHDLELNNLSLESHGDPMIYMANVKMARDNYKKLVETFDNRLDEELRKLTKKDGFSVHNHVMPPTKRNEKFDLNLKRSVNPLNQLQIKDNSGNFVNVEDYYKNKNVNDRTNIRGNINNVHIECFYQAEDAFSRTDCLNALKSLETSNSFFSPREEDIKNMEPKFVFNILKSLGFQGKLKNDNVTVYCQSVSEWWNNLSSVNKSKLETNNKLSDELQQFLENLVSYINSNEAILNKLRPNHNENQLYGKIDPVNTDNNTRNYKNLVSNSITLQRSQVARIVESFRPLIRSSHLLAPVPSSIQLLMGGSVVPSLKRISELPRYSSQIRSMYNHYKQRLLNMNKTLSENTQKSIEDVFNSLEQKEEAINNTINCLANYADKLNQDNDFSIRDVEEEEFVNACKSYDKNIEKYQKRLHNLLDILTVASKATSDVELKSEVVLSM